MLGNRRVILAAIAGLSIANAAGLNANSEGGLKCRIESRSAGGMTELKGVVVAGRGVKGRYQFTISSSGAGGSSDVRQAGDFSAEAGKKAEVGFASLSIDGHYKAALSVVVDGKTYQCREEFGGAL